MDEKEEKLTKFLPGTSVVMEIVGIDAPGFPNGYHLTEIVSATNVMFFVKAPEGFAFFVESQLSVENGPAIIARPANDYYRSLEMAYKEANPLPIFPS